MQRLLDKWGLWIALFVVGGIISYGLISGYLKEDAPTGKAAAGAPKAAPAKSFD